MTSDTYRLNNAHAVIVLVVVVSIIIIVMMIIIIILIPGSNEVRELQKTTVLGTADILRKVLT